VQYASHCCVWHQVEVRGGVGGDGAEPTAVPSPLHADALTWRAMRYTGQLLGGGLQIQARVFSSHRVVCGIPSSALQASQCSPTPLCSGCSKPSPSSRYRHHAAIPLPLIAHIPRRHDSPRPLLFSFLLVPPGCAAVLLAGVGTPLDGTVPSGSPVCVGHHQ
jgi:hypothetical protein